MLDNPIIICYYIYTARDKGSVNYKIRCSSYKKSLIIHKLLRGTLSRCNLKIFQKGLTISFLYDIIKIHQERKEESKWHDWPSCRTIKKPLKFSTSMQLYSTSFWCPFSSRNIFAAENISLKRLDNLPLMCYNKYIR